MVSNSLFATAASTVEYAPKSNRIKLPLMPGSIIAQMAKAPLKMRYQGASEPAVAFISVMA